MYRNYSQDADRIVFGVKAIRKNPANIGTRHPGEIYRKVLGLLSSPEELETFHKVLRMSSKMILKEDGEKVIQGLQAYMEAAREAASEPIMGTPEWETAALSRIEELCSGH